MEQAQADPMIEALLVPQAPAEQQAEVPAQVEVQPVAQPQAAPEPAYQPARTVPLPELMEERHKRQLAERERDAERREAAIYRQFIEAQRQPQQQQPVIDPISDPEGAFRALQAQNHQLVQSVQSQAVHQRANMSEMLARERHGDEAVNAAQQAAIQAGLGQHFLNQPQPYKALMDWHNSARVAQEVGTDLAAYRQRVEQEVRAQLIAEAKAAGKPIPQNLPPSLSTATRASVPSAHVQDPGDFFNSMFAKKPRT